MSYIKYRFHEFEEDIIEKYFPNVKYEENEVSCWYDLSIQCKENFNLKFLNMMEELLLLGDGEFWIDPQEGILSAGPHSRNRNIWEYYRYVCKELSK